VLFSILLLASDPNPRPSRLIPRGRESEKGIKVEKEEKLIN
jgi:hypothetical protein